MATLGERLKQLRIENNLRQKDLSNEFNVTERMLQYYEANKSEPSLKVIKFACERFNVSADYFLGISDERKSLYFTGFYLLYHIFMLHTITSYCILKIFFMFIRNSFLHIHMYTYTYRYTHDIIHTYTIITCFSSQLAVKLSELTH